MVSTWGTISQAGQVASSGAPSGSVATLTPLLPWSTRQAHEIVVRPLLILHPSFCFRCSHIRWRHWRKRIRAPASSGWVCGRTSLLAIHPSLVEPHLHSLDAPDLRRLSRQLNKHQPPQSPNLLKVGEIEGTNARRNATLSRSTKDPGPRSPWTRCLRNPPQQPGRKRRGPSLATTGPPRKQPLLYISPPPLVLGTEESVFMDPHGPTIAPRCPTATIADKIKSIHFQKESKNLFLPTISILPLCSQSAQLFQTLAMRAEAWQAILGVLTLVMTKVRRGYTLQFARRPPRFRGVLATTVRSENAQVLHAEADESAGKRSHRNRSSSPERVRLLQPLLPCPQKRRRPKTYSRSQIPELCPDEKVVQDDHFETDPPANMPRGLVHVTGSERCVFSHPGCPRHRQFLRFAFEGVAYQYKVLPFGLSLAPRTFTRCMDAALSPLRQMEIRTLNYLDDWLILAQSQAVLASHKTLLLSHLDCLGLRVNFDKSILSPSQWVSFLGTVIDSVQMTATSRKVPPRQVREQRHKLILIAPIWRNQPWVSEIFQLLKSAPWPIPLRTSSLKRTARYGIHGPSYESCMCGRSTGAFRTPRVCPKHYGRS